MVLKETGITTWRPFMVAAFATLIAIVATFSASANWASSQASADGTGPAPGGTGPSPELPDGQLIRRGLSGIVVAVGDSSFVVGTRHGNVEVFVNGDTVIKQPPHGEATINDIEDGMKVGALLVKPDEDNAEPSGLGDHPVFRAATALRVMIVPSKAQRQHNRAILLEKIKDKAKNHIKFLNEDGDEEEAETEIEIEGEEGDEVLLITVRGHNGKAPQIAGSVAAGKIEERLERLAEKKTELEAKLQEVRERHNELMAERLSRVNDREEKIQARIDEARAKAEARAEEARLIAEARLQNARQDAEERIQQARQKAEDRIEAARQKAEERIQKAKDRADQQRLQRGRR